MIELPRSNRTGCTGVSTAVIYCKVNDRFRWYYFVSLHNGRIKVFVKETIKFFKSQTTLLLQFVMNLSSKRYEVDANVLQLLPFFLNSYNKNHSIYMTV